DSLPFEVLTIGGQTMAYLPGGRADLPKLTSFAREHPDMFEIFFPNVNIADLLAGKYNVLDNPEASNSASDVGSVASTDDSLTGSPPPMATDVPRTRLRTNLTTSRVRNPCLQSYWLTSKLIHPSLCALCLQDHKVVLRTPSLTAVCWTLLTSSVTVVANCTKHIGAHSAFIQRSIKDRTRLFPWDPRRAVPSNPHELRDAAYRSFLAGQGLPSYVPPTRISASYVPRQRSVNTRSAGVQNVVGGVTLWCLTRDPSPLDIIYSVAGSTVVPEDGRIYTFEELFPD
ncbi:hypothetical protein BD626DRAFT_352407, partial [Schizophyllum amplum]